MTMVPKNDDDELPPEVQAEVDKALADGGQEEPTDERVTTEIPEGDGRPLSRRARERMEEKAQVDAALKRAEAAEKIAEELRRGREQDVERFARMEQALNFIGQQRQQEPAPRREEPAGPSHDDKVRDIEREQAEALAKNDLDGYNRAARKLVRLEAEHIADARIAAFRQQIPQQQAPVQAKPPWVTAVEAQYADVMMHPAGMNAVVSFINLDQSAFGPEKLNKAFTRARTELGLGAAPSGDDKGKNEARRQQLAGGATHGAPAARGNGKAGRSVNMPKGWEAHAARAGMTKAEYIKAYAEGHPEDVVQ